MRVAVERCRGKHGAPRGAAAVVDPPIAAEGGDRHAVDQRDGRDRASAVRARRGDDLCPPNEQAALETIGGLVEQRGRAPQQHQRRDQRDRDVQHDELPEQRARRAHHAGVASSI